MACTPYTVAPGLKTGRGLEQIPQPSTTGKGLVAPGLKTGRGLEQRSHVASWNHPRVAPGLKTGRGLEHALQRSQRCTET